MSKQEKIAVLLPCFNEEKTIEKVVSSFREALPEAFIYVYDNNSTDNTISYAKEQGAIIRHCYLQGKGNVIRQMFQEVEADIYILCDGDDTYPADIAPMMVNMIKNGTDMVVGDRLSSTYYEENKRPFHGIGNAFVKWSINQLFHVNIKDVMTGYRAFSYRFIKTFPITSRGFEIETEMTIHAADGGFMIRNLPVEYKDRPEGSISKLHTIKDGIKVLKTIIRLFRYKKPMPFFFTGGVCFILLGLSLFIPVLMEYIDTHLVARFPTLIVSMFFLFGGMISFFTGFILDATSYSMKCMLERHLMQIQDQKRIEERNP